MPRKEVTVEGWYSIRLYLGVSERTAHKWYEDGLLPCIHKNWRTGRMWAVETELRACKAIIERPLPKHSQSPRKRATARQGDGRRAVGSLPLDRG